MSRPVQPLGKDIGFLPGTMNEKMLPWLMPIQDNMQFILGNDRAKLRSYLETGEIEIEALTYIRGRSISNAFVIIDEAQNLTAHEVKTIITRIGENTKIVLTGDIEQIDNIYTNETSNGLAYAVERFKNSELSGHITFKKGGTFQDCYSCFEDTIIRRCYDYSDDVLVVDDNSTCRGAIPKNQYIC